MARTFASVQQILAAQKRSLVRFVDLNSAEVKKSTAVKLADGNGPLLEVKRNGVPMKKYHANLNGWFATLPPGAQKKIFLQPPPLTLGKIRRA